MGKNILVRAKQGSGAAVCVAWQWGERGAALGSRLAPPVGHRAARWRAFASRGPASCAPQRGAPRVCGARNPGWRVVPGAAGGAERSARGPGSCRAPEIRRGHTVDLGAASSVGAVDDSRPGTRAAQHAPGHARAHAAPRCAPGPPRLTMPRAMWAQASTIMAARFMAVLGRSAPRVAAARPAGAAVRTVSGTVAGPCIVLYLRDALCLAPVLRLLPDDGR